MFLDRYEIHETIGEGGFAKVKLGTHKLTRETVAIKVINRRSANTRFVRFDLEIRAMKELSHDNICQLYEHYENDSHIFLVLEHCSGGELFEYIVANDRVPERDARLFFRQILSAVTYIHHSGYVHRDLKPENLLLNENGHVKITDFGLCAHPEKGIRQFLKTRCGSPCYIAPEILEGRNYLGGKSDVWSMGVLLFTLVAGYLPYDSENVNVLLRKIKLQPLQLPSFLSTGCRNLILRMLEVEPESRARIEDLCHDAWVTNFFEEPPVTASGNHAGWALPKSKVLHLLLMTYSSSIFQPRNRSNRIDLEIVRFLSEQVCLSMEATRFAVEANNFEYLHSAYLIMLSMKKKGILHRMEKYYRFRFNQDLPHTFDPLPPPGSCVDRLVCSCVDSACLQHVKETNRQEHRSRKRNAIISPAASPLKDEIKRFLVERSMWVMKRKKRCKSPLLPNGISISKAAMKCSGKLSQAVDTNGGIASSAGPERLEGNNDMSSITGLADTTYPVAFSTTEMSLTGGGDPSDSTFDQRRRRRRTPNVLKGINAAFRRVMSPIRNSPLAKKTQLLMFTRRRGPKLCKDQINVCPTKYECSVKLVFALEHVLNSLLIHEKAHFTRNVYIFRVTVREDLICKLEVVSLPSTYFGVRRKRIAGNAFSYKAFTIMIMNRLRTL